MREPIFRVTLFVPGTAASLAAWDAALRRNGLRIDGDSLLGSKVAGTVRVEYVAADGKFGQAFAFGNVPAPAIARIDGAPGAILVDLPVDLREGRAEIVALVESLRDAGALGVRLEQSHLGWEVSAWLELLSSINPWDWHRATIVYLDGEEALQSCGMHAFSLPDARVEIEGDAGASQNLASALNVYQITEAPLLFSGQTFSHEESAPRRVVERWPDVQYAPGHTCHNPYGVWRIGPAGGVAHPIPELVPTFMLDLHALLLALEQKSDEPLSREQVEAALAGAPCIAMERRDAQKLEHARGYADLNPALLWEQWQLVRTRKE
jgi:hypothetical protein